MKSYRVLFGALAALSLPLSAIPNQVGGFLAQTESPLNDTDLTAILLGDGVWAGNENLPGIWRDEAPIAAVKGSYLAARPRVFGLPAIMVQARHRSGNLDSLAITFADAGSYFGYSSENIPPGLSKRAHQAEHRRRVAEKRQAFSKHFSETQITLMDALRNLA